MRQSLASASHKKVWSKVIVAFEKYLQLSHLLSLKTEPVCAKIVITNLMKAAVYCDM